VVSACLLLRQTTAPTLPTDRHKKFRGAPLAIHHVNRVSHTACCQSLPCAISPYQVIVRIVSPHLMSDPFAGSGPSPSLMSQNCKPLGELVRSQVAAAWAG
jgi:hypothetical protein